MRPTGENKLKKDIGFTVALSIVVGSVIGSGVFMKPGTVIAYSGDSTMALWAWFLGGILTLASGLTIAEISAQIPKTGGLYVYLEEVYGKFWGYLSGWVQTIIYGPAIIGALGLYFGSLVAHLFALDGHWKISIGIGAVLFLTLINSLGTKYGGFIQTLFTVGKLIPIALIIIFGIWKGQSPVLDMESGIAGDVNLGAAILATLFAYDGWLLVGSVAGEIKNPDKILPRAIIVGLLMVTVIYLSVNIALLHVLPADKIVSLGENAAGTAATLVFGDLGGKLISIGIIVSIFGTLNAKILSFPRVPYAMAIRGQLPGSRYLARIHPTFRTPVIATVSQALLAIVLMIVSNPDKLTDISVFAIFLFFAQAFFAVFILRKRNAGKTRPYSVPLYPFIPIVALLGTIFILVSTVINDPKGTFLCIVITLAGLPIYWWVNRNRKEATIEQKAAS
ncbi:APC family permease [Lihuaxuella thermophila]|uniref:Basic amino acid/polyamine antiporter, APA family n=1 Tax=Lihuaxuella thermophila TaxID=1173111 RepID=A0A1H8H8N9_9BACL|nr:amino acid permease [Lihuaxuella thermophila]SEN52603.1 basic amino acid/polyamine antiporter, APA family [Lihuaxuella thermophila]